MSARAHDGWSMVGALCLVLAAPLTSFAQEPSGPPPNATDQHLVLEPESSGFAIAPDVRFGSVNGRTATFAGAYGGWMYEKTLLVGAGGYWLANRSHDFEMQYGGFVVEWLSHADQRIGFGTRALVGGGTATLSGTFGDLFDFRGMPPPADNASWRGMERDFRGPKGVKGWPTISANTPVIAHDSFFVFEPQANLLIEITPWMRLNAGVGYRVIGGAEGMNDELRGASGTVAIQFGSH